MPYSNAKIENLHPHIKALKRVTYGFRSFQKMKSRFFLINHMLIYEFHPRVEARDFLVSYAP
ncbi:hypothetical protein HMPREF9520_03038 [Enterococcus faecalis TX1467]|nr:hypothetical protein HMPREF9520_03038 [Enterococcus faecalis TX1467]